MRLDVGHGDRVGNVIRVGGAGGGMLEDGDGGCEQQTKQHSMPPMSDQVDAFRAIALVQPLDELVLNEMLVHNLASPQHDRKRDAGLRKAVDPHERLEAIDPARHLLHYGTGYVERDLLDLREVAVV